MSLKKLFKIIAAKKILKSLTKSRLNFYMFALTLVNLRI